MTQTADIIIIGGGITGASIAYALASQGAKRVILLERRGLSTGTTGHSGAIVRQHYSHDITIRMAQESLRVFERFDEIVGGNCGFTQTGLLVLGSLQGASSMQATIARQQHLGVNTRIISPSDIHEVAPDYNSEDVALACYEVEAGVADSVATTYSYGNRARDLGVIIHEGVTVTEILTHNTSITGVATTQGAFLAPQVILAANVWSVPLAQQLGIALPVKATRHPMVVLRRPPARDGRPSTHAICFDETQDTYFIPGKEGITLLGSLRNVEAESNPDNYLQAVTADEIRTFHTLGGKRFPALKQAVIRGGWAGIYDDTPDYHPILGRLTAYEGLYCAAGFSGHGFKLAPCISRWMAQLILNGECPPEMQHFSYERFSQGGTINPGYSSGVLG